MKNVVWVLEETVRAVHSRQIAEHGGSEGVRDEGLLLSALARPQNLYVHGENIDITALAASYAYGIAKDHPFIGSNKRTALVVMRLFIALNDVEFRATQEETYTTFLQLADGNINEAELAAWIRKRVA
jgi:death-on-curing protein